MFEKYLRNKILILDGLSIIGYSLVCKIIHLGVKKKLTVCNLNVIKLNYKRANRYFLPPNPAEILEVNISQNVGVISSLRIF